MNFGKPFIAASVKSFFSGLMIPLLKFWWIFSTIVFLILIFFVSPFIEKYKDLINSISGAFFGSLSAIAFASVKENIEKEEKRKLSLLNLRRTFSEQEDSLNILREYLEEGEKDVLNNEVGKLLKQSEMHRILIKKGLPTWKCSSLINCDELSWMFVNDKNKESQSNLYCQLSVLNRAIQKLESTLTERDLKKDEWEREIEDKGLLRVSTESAKLNISKVQAFRSTIVLRDVTDILFSHLTRAQTQRSSLSKEFERVFKEELSSFPRIVLRERPNE